MNTRFPKPVAVCDAARSILVEDAESAAEFLLKRWPTFRGPRHADACAISLLVASGSETASVAHAAFVAAAREADILLPYPSTAGT